MGTNHPIRYFLAVNVQGHVNLLEACRYAGVGKVVFSSSTAIYGETGADSIAEHLRVVKASLDLKRR